MAILDRLPERHTSPMDAARTYVARRAGASREANLERRLRMLERRGVGGGADLPIEELAEDDDIDPVDLTPGRMYRKRGRDNTPDQVVTVVQQADDSQVLVQSYEQSDPWAAPPFTDDFYSFNGWNASGPGNVTTQVGTAAHPGVVRLATGGTSGNIERLHLGTAGTDTILIPTNFDARFIVSPVTITNVVIRVGFSADWTVNVPNNWVGFEFDSANADYHFVCRAAGADVFNSASAYAVLAGQWDRMRLRSALVGGVNTYYFSTFFAAEVALVGAASPVAMQPGFQIRTTNATTKQLDVDYYRYQPYGVVR